jgi:hypothetical protein
LAYCGAVCGKGRYIESSDSDKGVKLGLFARSIFDVIVITTHRFIREYFDVDLFRIGYLPLALVKVL